jgi:hypothetical protein
MFYKVRIQTSHKETSLLADVGTRHTSLKLLQTWPSTLLLLLQLRKQMRQLQLPYSFGSSLILLAFIGMIYFPLPHHWKELRYYTHMKHFEAAAQAKFDSCWSKGTFASPDITADRMDAVPLMWVFSYKFDEDGYLLMYKARLVVHGDLQEQYGNTSAATLAACLFQTLMALACVFNLEAKQYDVPNAFLIAILDCTLHMRTPDGFQDRYGQTL